MEEIEKKLKMLDPARLPGHVAIIMDGNGRWRASVQWSAATATQKA